MPRLLELFCGTKSVGRAFEAAGWEVVSLDIVSKFEPTVFCDIRSWDYTTFPGHFDMVWASPVCTEYSRALTTRPRRLLEGDALVLSALCASPAAAARRGRTAGTSGPRSGAAADGGQYERVSQSRELLYSVPAALCEEIARAATEELAERLSIPD